MGRTEFLLRRLGFGLMTVFIAATINFVIFRAAPGDAATQYQQCLTCSPGFRDELRAELGLDRPLLVQYVLYLRDLVQLDFGTSFQNQRPVSSELLGALANTLPMLGLGLLIGLVLGVAVGVLSAWRRGRATDVVLMSVSLFFYSLPVQWLGLVLLFAFSGSLPVSGIEDPYLRLTDPSTMEVVADRLRHLALPSATIGLVWFGSWALLVRSSMLEALGEDYVLTARAKGLRTWTIIRRYALRNSLLPIVTLVLLTLGYTVAGTLLVETVFSYPGIGLELYRAVQNRDYAVLQGGFLLLTIAIVVANLLADLLYFRLDPRIES